MNFKDSLLVIGGGQWDSSYGILARSVIFEATVEIFNQTKWEEKQDMSPVNALTKLAHFSTISVGDNLYIFGFVFVFKKNNV